MVTSWRHLKTCFSIFNFLTKLTLVTQQRSINKGEAQVTMRSSMSFFILDTHCQNVSNGCGGHSRDANEKRTRFRMEPWILKWQRPAANSLLCEKQITLSHVWYNVYTCVQLYYVIHIMYVCIYRMRERVKYSHRVGSEAGCLLCTCSSWLVLLQAEQTIEASSTHHASCTSTNSFTVVHIQKTLLWTRSIESQGWAVSNRPSLDFIKTVLEVTGRHRACP